MKPVVVAFPADGRLSKAIHMEMAAAEHLAILRAVIRRDAAEAQTLLDARIGQGQRHALELFFDRTCASRSRQPALLHRHPLSYAGR
ncbi:MAG: hypothetical protein ABI693_02865 [Bryobacteraceae bacterium]